MSLFQIKLAPEKSLKKFSSSPLKISKEALKSGPVNSSLLYIVGDLLGLKSA